MKLTKHVRYEQHIQLKYVTLFACLLLNGTSALFRPLVPRIVEVEHTRHVEKRYCI